MQVPTVTAEAAALGEGGVPFIFGRYQKSIEISSTHAEFSSREQSDGMNRCFSSIYYVFSLVLFLNFIYIMFRNVCQEHRRH